MKSQLLTLAVALCSSIVYADKEQELRGPEKQAMILLKTCDKDKSGDLTKAEFSRSDFSKALVRRQGEEEASRTFTKADNNKDGVLSKGELERMNYHLDGSGSNKKGKHKVHAKGKGKAKGK